MKSDDIHLAIVSKNEIIREGLRRILNDEGFDVDCAVSCPERIDPACHAAVVIVDAHDIDEALLVCVEVREQHPEGRIVLMADECRMEDVSRAFATGAVDGYLVKEISCGPLAGALRLTALGEKVLPSRIIESLISAPPPGTTSCWTNGASGSNLSAREVDILRCLVEGEPNKVISRRLSIADATVKVHIKAILRKLHVRNRTQAAIWAVNRGLANEPEESPSAYPALAPTTLAPAAISSQIAIGTLATR